jgi:tRNA A37 threonylcarbamoyladenosine dehydratase
MHKLTIMIVGLGDLGGWVLEILARYPRIAKIVSLDLNED